MMQNLSNALIITGIGMGLVFVALLLLWLMMVLVIKIKDPVEKAEEQAEILEDASLEDAPAVPASDRKCRAAAAAVAIALGLQKTTSTGLANLSSAETTGGWQTSIRANNLSRRANLFSRKPRG